ncbi:MAG: nuclear transport factor 2 family protein [Gemmatimonadaceae bacterium]
MTHEQEVRELNDAYIRSILAGDVAWFREHLADEFICIESDASIVDKPAFLRGIGEAPSVESYNLDDVAVSLYGDAALVRATGSWVAKNGNRGISRYVDVYARIDGSWKAVSAQITRPPGKVAR